MTGREPQTTYDSINLPTNFATDVVTNHKLTFSMIKTGKEEICAKN